MPSFAKTLRRSVPIAARLRDALLGVQCGICGQPDQDPCDACRHRVVARERTRLRCVRCAETMAIAVPDGEGVSHDARLSAAARLCARCLRDPPAFDRTLCAADYAPPLDRVELALKFGRQAHLGSTLGRLLADALRPEELAALDAIVAVPLAPLRLAERGYNQADLIARHIARVCGLPLRRDALVRVRSTPPITGRAREERLALMRAAFAAPVRLDGMAFGLVDDVMTTGATLHEAAHALKAAGATRVVALAALRTAPE